MQIVCAESTDPFVGSPGVTRQLVRVGYVDTRQPRPVAIDGEGLSGLTRTDLADGTVEVPVNADRPSPGQRRARVSCGPVTATCNNVERPRYGNLDVDANLRDPRISRAGPAENTFTAAVLAGADPRYAQHPATPANPTASTGAEPMLTLALDVGGTKIAAGLVDGTGLPVHTDTRPTRADQDAEVVWTVDFSSTVPRTMAAVVDHVDGPACRCGGRGCVVAIASGPAMVRWARTSG